MSTEDKIRALSRRMTDAPEESDEFQAVVDSLRASIKARAAHGREQLGAFQSVPGTPSPVVQLNR